MARIRSYGSGVRHRSAQDVDHARDGRARPRRPRSRVALTGRSDPVSDAGRLDAWLADGALVAPDASGPDSVDLARALFGLAGDRDLELSSEAQGLRDAIGDYDHYVFVLIDGLGLETLRGSGGFLEAHSAVALRAVFPSTTAAALTSLATAEQPANHGVPGWWVYLRERDLSATVIPFRERFGGTSLDRLGVSPDELFPVASRVSRLTHAPLTITPAEFVNDRFSVYTSGGTQVTGYGSLAEAFALAIGRVGQAGSPSYTSLYIPDLDQAAHLHGVTSDTVTDLLMALDRMTRDLRDALGGRARIVVTGDHGLVDLAEDRILVMEEGDPVLDLLACPPTGEPTVPLFHVEDGREDEFRERFREVYGPAFALITPDQAEDRRLFGPGSLSDVMRSRLGSLIGIARKPAALHYRPAAGAVHPNVGVHAGLTPAEMMVPLVLA